MTSRIHTLFSVVASIVVLLTVVWGVMIVGSPKTARTQRFDAQRLGDLRTISREIQSLCHDPDMKDKLKRPLPTTLKQLATLARTERIKLTDPETGKEYGYRLKDERTYELCATFSLTRDSDVDVFWNHEPGERCFTIDAFDPP